MANVLEVELKSQQLLDLENDISPESLAFLYYSYPQNTQTRETNLISNYAKRIYNGDSPSINKKRSP